MNRPDSRLVMGGTGLATACAAIRCSAPLLVLAVPGLAVLVGTVTGAITLGLIGAVVLGALALTGAVVWRRRQGTCSQERPFPGLLGSSCADPQGCVRCRGRDQSSHRNEVTSAIPIIVNIGAAELHPSSSVAPNDADREGDSRLVSTGPSTTRRTGA